MGRYRNWIVLGLISLVSSLSLWLPFSANLSNAFGVYLPPGGMKLVQANFDGPLYIVVAKSWYDFREGNSFEFPLPNEYYAAHFPLYPFLISLFGLLTNNTWAMLVVTLISSIGAVWAFYYLAQKYLTHEKAFLLSMVFLFFPARYFVVRSIGSPEPLFLMFIILSLAKFVEKKYWLAAAFGTLATLTKSPGILIFAGFLTYLWITKKDLGKQLKNFMTILLIPLGLLSVFGLFKLQTGDFLAYFHSGDNIHLETMPFGIFNSTKPWVGTFWLEDVIWIYALGILGFIKLGEQKRVEMAAFVGIFLATIFFVSHRDISRYALPMVPFLLIALGDTISIDKKHRWLLGILLIPIYLYALNFIAGNAMPISDWSKLL